MYNVGQMLCLILTGKHYTSSCTYFFSAFRNAKPTGRERPAKDGCQSCRVLAGPQVRKEPITLFCLERNLTQSSSVVGIQLIIGLNVYK